MYFGGMIHANKGLNQIAMDFIVTKPNFEKNIYQIMPNNVQKQKSDYGNGKHVSHDQKCF